MLNDNLITSHMENTIFLNQMVRDFFQTFFLILNLFKYWIKALNNNINLKLQFLSVLLETSYIISHVYFGNFVIEG